MKFAVIKVRLNEVNEVQRAFPQWELPVLESVHGRNKLTFVGYQTVKNYDLGSPEGEFARLEERYGKVPKTDTAHVEAAYGGGTRGIAALAKAMEAATGLSRAALDERERSVSADVPTAKGLPEIEIGDEPPAVFATDIDE